MHLLINVTAYHHHHKSAAFLYFTFISGIEGRKMLHFLFCVLEQMSVLFSVFWFSNVLVKWVLNTFQ